MTQDKPRDDDVQPTIRIDTGGGAVIMGNVTVTNGDFVGRDQHVGAHGRAPLPTTPGPRTLVVWADVPFPPGERPPRNPALAIQQWQEEAAALPPPACSLPDLPPLPILSLDPTDRVAAAFRAAGVPLTIVRTRHDVVPRGQHSLLQLGGDLATRTGLLQSWDNVRAAANDADKVHLLREAGRIAQNGVVVVLAPAPTAALVRLWHELVAPHLPGAAQYLAFGPADFAWPAPLVWQAGEPVDWLAALQLPPSVLQPPSSGVPQEPPPPLADLAALRRWLNRHFDDPGLDALCLDHFPRVYDRFGRGLRKDEKLTLLLDDLRRDPAGYDRLLAALED